MKNSFFKPNLEPTGRLVRAVAGLVIFNAALVAAVVGGSPALTISLAIISAFLFFQAVRGWCLMRACGIKTKL